MGADSEKILIRKPAEQEAAGGFPVATTVSTGGAPGETEVSQWVGAGACAPAVHEGRAIWLG